MYSVVESAENWLHYLLDKILLFYIIKNLVQSHSYMYCNKKVELTLKNLILCYILGKYWLILKKYAAYWHFCYSI